MNKLMKSTIILLIGGFVTKILSMVIRIVLSRLLGTEGIGIYMIILPTFSLFISLTSLGLPQAISKLVSENKRNNKRLVFSIIPITLLFDLFVIILIVIFSDFISISLLHDIKYKYIIISMGLVLPFIDISSVLRGYFFGRQKMLPHVISNIVEDIVRLIFLIIGIPYFISNISNTIIYIILVNIVSEIASILILFIFLPRNFNITRNDFKMNFKDILDTFRIGIPTTLGRLVGNIGYFLEPIILTNTLLHIGYTNNFIVYEYGIINGYVMPILLLPSFFTYTISSALLPIVSSEYANKNIKNVKKRIYQAITYSLLIGVTYTIFILIKPEFILNILYHTKEGVNYIRFLAPICILHYIQAPLTSSLQALGYASKAMRGTIIGTILRCLSIFIFSYLHIGIYPILIASGINILTVTIHHIKTLKKIIKYHP